MVREDLKRFLIVVLFSLIIGLAVSHVAISLLVGVTLFSIWQYRILYRVYTWLLSRNESNPPEQSGLVDALCSEIDFLRNRQRQRTQKLTGYLSRFQAATGALPDAVIILGVRGEIEWANDKATEYLGIRWPQDNRNRLVNLIRHPRLSEFLVKNHQTSEKGLQLESPTNPGQILEFRLVPYGESQKLLVARDITEIQRAYQMRRDFIANASHELRTPLTVISGYLESFDDDREEFPEQVRSQIKQMRTQTARMQRLIEDLLTLSELETNRQDPLKETVRVPEMLGSIYQEAQGVSGIMNHIFYLESDPDLWLKGNTRELYSAFSNIVFNAVQHTPAEGIVRMRWYEDDQGAHFEVIDNGEGIAREHLHRLTERFYRVDKGRSRDKGGTGLGLAIVKHVLVRHGGSLHIVSEPGKGSTFRCDFPRKNIKHRFKEDSLNSLSA